MIIKKNKKNLEYDIYALFKAFFPEEEINIEADQEEKESTGIPSFYDVRISSSSASCSYFDGEVGHKKEEEFLSPDKGAIKDAIKRCIYECVSEISGRSLPWGTLTGIRPAKIPMLMIDKGSDDEEIRKYMKYRHLVSDEKIGLIG